jgi:hypothetical protein
VVVVIVVMVAFGPERRGVTMRIAPSPEAVT